MSYTLANLRSEAVGHGCWGPNLTHSFSQLHRRVWGSGGRPQIRVRVGVKSWAGLTTEKSVATLSAICSKEDGVYRRKGQHFAD